MKAKNLFLTMCLTAVLGISACGGQNAANNTNTAASSEVAASAAQPSEQTASASGSTTKNNTAEPAVKVNINTATAEELVSALKGTGVGEAKVKKIIAYREEHKGFKSVDELTEVKGIGDKTVEKLRARVTVQ